MIPPARGNCRLGARREASADVRLCGGCRSGREAAPVACAALEYPRGDRHRLLWRLLRVRLHRAARATSQPPTPLLKYRHRVAPGGLQPSQHRRDARLRGHHRPFGNAEVAFHFRRVHLRWPCRYRAQSAAGHYDRRSPVRWLGRRSTGISRQRRRGPVVLARWAEPGVRSPGIGGEAGIVGCSGFPGMGAWCVHLLALASSSRCRLRRALPVRRGALLDARFPLGHIARSTKIPLGEIFRFNRSFWLIAALCVTFYGCIFPFETFGQKFLIEARHVTPQTASLLVGMEPFFSLIGMPIFGLLVDRYGHRSLLMMFGSLLIVPVFPMLGFSNIPPAIPMAMMGVAFALVPAVMWPALVYVVEKSRLGLANGMLDSVQQLGLVVINLLIGWANDHWLASATNAAGYHAGLLMFTAIAVLAVLCAFAFWRAETGPSSHGLETITTRL